MVGIRWVPVAKVCWSGGGPASAELSQGALLRVGVQIGSSARCAAVWVGTWQDLLAQGWVSDGTYAKVVWRGWACRWMAEAGSMCGREVEDRWMAQAVVWLLPSLMLFSLEPTPRRLLRRGPLFNCRLARLPLDTRLVQTENPIPFSDSSLERKLTTGYLHARYAGLLVAPVQVRAGRAFNRLAVFEFCRRCVGLPALCGVYHAITAGACCDCCRCECSACNQSQPAAWTVDGI